MLGLNTLRGMMLNARAKSSAPETACNLDSFLVEYAPKSSSMKAPDLNTNSRSFGTDFYETFFLSDDTYGHGVISNTFIGSKNSPLLISFLLFQ